VTRALFVGRFQPFHYGHLYAIEKILEENDELLLVVGSAQMSHEPDNPFTAGERIEMIRAALDGADIPSERYMIIPISDAPAHRVWVSAVESQTPRFDLVYSNQPLTRRLLIEAGCEVRNIPLYQRGKYEATEIRRRILEGEDWSDLVPPEVYRIVQEIDGENRIRDLAKTDSVNAGRR
jgi:nicotinamide-nucleotide adenylyltransferase